MREIEIKARVSDKNALLKVLDEAGVRLSKPLSQRDIVWLEKGAVPTNYVGRNALRIRIENGTKALFTLKRTLATMDKIEHESVIDNADEMRAAIEMLDGFELFNDLTKVRQKAQIGDIEICVDEVKRLGTFVELEKMAADDADSEMVRDELWAILERYGIKRADEVTKGYDILMHEKEEET